MTHDEARAFFREQLPDVRNTAELLRLTLWCLPHLAVSPQRQRPLGAIETIALDLKLDFGAGQPQKVRTWVYANRDISEQLAALGPLYPHGLSNGSNYCSGATNWTRMPNGPSTSARGLSLGAFASEHAAVDAQLNAAATVEEWWSVLLSNTPLWMRTAYHWERPTAQQQETLDNAKTAMLRHATTMAENTHICYRNEQAHVYFKAPIGLQKGSGYTNTPYWYALMAGQAFVALAVDDSSAEKRRLEVQDFRAMATVLRDINMVCGLHGGDLDAEGVQRLMERTRTDAQSVHQAAGVSLAFLEDALPVGGTMEP